MPYIKPEDREPFDDDVDAIAKKISNCGELNYVITRIVHNYIQSKSHRYTTMNEVIGAMECAKLELYRTVAAPYEDKKIEENGYVSKTDDKHHITLWRDHDNNALKKLLTEGQVQESNEDQDYP